MVHKVGVSSRVSLALLLSLGSARLAANRSRPTASTRHRSWSSAPGTWSPSSRRRPGPPRSSTPIASSRTRAHCLDRFTRPRERVSSPSSWTPATPRGRMKSSLRLPEWMRRDLLRWPSSTRGTGRRRMREVRDGPDRRPRNGGQHALSVHRVRAERHIHGNHDDRSDARRLQAPGEPRAGAGDVQRLPTSDSAFQFVEALAASGITAGCGSGNYCPDAFLTRRQMAVFLAKALGLHWPAGPLN